MFDRLKCIIGLHDWKVSWNKTSPLKILVFWRTCKRCDKEEFMGGNGGR